MKKNMKIILMTGIVIVMCMSSLAAETGIPVMNIHSAVASPNTSAFAPVLYCYDDNPESAWGFTDGASEAWAEFSLGETSLIDGIGMTSVHSLDTFVTLEFHDGQKWIAFSGTTLRLLGPGEEFIDLSYDNAVTMKIRLTVESVSLDDCRFFDIKVYGRARETVLHKVNIKKVKTGGMESWNTPAAHLIDNNPFTVWQLIPEYGGIKKFNSYLDMFWHVDDGRDTVEFFSGEETLAEFEKNWNNYKEAEDRCHDHEYTGSAILELGSPYSVETIMVHIAEGTESVITLYVWKDYQWQQIDEIDTTEEEGWYRKGCAPVIEGVSKVKIKQSGIHGSGGGIGEIEVWGYGEYSGDTHKPVVLPMKASLAESFTIGFSHKYCKDKKGGIEIETDAMTDALTIDFNGSTYAGSKRLVNGGHGIFGFEIPPDRYWDGENFIKVVGDGSGSQVYSIRMHEKKEYGIQPVIQGELGDMMLYTEVPVNESMEWEFPAELYIKQVEVYAVEQDQGEIWIREAGEWYRLFSKEERSAISVYEGGLYADAIRIVPGSNVLAGEIRVLGSLTLDKIPEVRIRVENHDNNRCYGGNSLFVTGFVDNPEAVVTVNGLPVEQCGHYFWVKIAEEDILAGDDGYFTITASAVDAKERTGTCTIRVLMEDKTHIRVNLPEEVYYTDKESITITGKISPWHHRVVTIDDEVAATGKPGFSYEKQLEYGLNLIKIQVRDLFNDTIIKTVYRKVVRIKEEMYLDISSPQPFSYIRTETVIVTGQVFSLGRVKVYVNGKKASVENGIFTSHPVWLKEGENTLNVTALDNFHNRVEKTIIVYRDTAGPRVTLTHPYNGYISSTSTVLFTGTVHDTSDVWVYVNNVAAEVTGETFSISLEFTDGYKDIEVKAVDTAGNVSESIELTIIVDTKPPEAFEIHSNAETWVNNPTPVITFSTTDAASGIDHYELSIDGEAFIVVTSPYQCPELGEGEHTVIVNAYDRAGWKQGAQAKLYIDTIAPGVPLYFRTVPGNGRMVLKWSRPDEDVIEYRLYRNESWEEEYKIVTDVAEAMEFTDENITNGETFEYSIIAVDKAYNVSESSPWIEGTTGLEKEPYSVENGALVEYEDITILVKKESLPETVKEIHVTEIVSEELAELAWYPIISPVYEFSVLVEQDGEETEQNHLEFEEEYVAFLSYDENNVPEDFPEENLDVYYFDPMWSRWFKVEKAMVDADKNLIIFATSHFSSFSLQPTMLEDLSPQQIGEVGYNPFKTVSSHNGVSVSPQGGTVMTEMTELVLPGKNGFDFVLKRQYDSATAQGDGFGMGIFVSIGFGISDIISGGILVELASLGGQVLSSLATSLASKLDNIMYNNGDYAYSMGMGWRLNLPYIRGSNSTILLRLPDGSFHSLNKMKIMEGFNVLGAYRKYTFECHENADFRLEVTQARKQISVAGIVQGSFLIPGWGLVDAKLIMNDGTTYTFKANGSVEEITDPSGLNKIKMYYSSNKLDYILDSMGRKIHFEYDHGFLVPRIKKIWVEDPAGPDREINYTIVSAISDDLKIFLPLLKKAVDVGGREYHYEYNDHMLFSYGGSIKINFLSLFLDIITFGAFSALGFDDITLSGHVQSDWVFVMKQAFGPGIGLTEVGYDIKALQTTTTEACDYLFGLFPTGIEISFEVSDRLSATSLRVQSREDNSLTKTITYSYDFTHKGNHQFISEKTVENDGRTITTYYFDSFKRDRRRWVDYWDTIYAMMGNIFNFNPNNIFTENPIFEEVIPVNTRVTIEDMQHNILDDQRLGWFTGNATRTYTYTIPAGYPNSGTHTETLRFPVTRITSRSNVRSETNKIVTDYTYDVWANPVYIREYMITGDRENLKEEWAYYLNTGTPPAAIFSSIPSPYTEPGISRHMKNLPLGHVVKNILPSETGITDPVFTVTYNNYSSRGQMTASSQWTGTGWAETRYAHNPDHGSVERVVSPNGHVKTIHYDYTQDPETYYISTTENDVTDADGNVHDLTTVEAYDFATGNLVWSKNPRGFVTGYEYDRLGRKTRIIEPDDDPGETGWDPRDGGRPEAGNNPVTTIVYNDQALWSRVTDANNARVFYDYNDLGNLIRIEKENNGISNYSVTRIGYDPWANITSITDPNNYTTTYTYDEKNRLSGIIHPGENGNQAVKKMNFNYGGNILITIDENKNVTEEVYDMKDRLIKQIRYNGIETIETLFYYDSLGNTVVGIDPAGNKTIKIYDEMNLLSQVLLPEDEFYENGMPVTIRPYIRYEYDAAGYNTREIRSTAGGEHQRIFENDGIGRLYRTTTSYTDAGGGVHEVVNEFFYDNSGNNIRTIDAVNTPLKYTGENYYCTEARYSAREKVIMQSSAVYRSGIDGTVIDPGKSTVYTYDKLANMKSMTDPRGTSGKYSGDFTLVYHYDGLNRLIRGELPAARDETIKRIVEYSYDPRGNVVEHRVSDGGVITYTYTPRNWLKTETVTEERSNRSYTTTHEYDEGGNEIHTRDNAGNVTINYYDNVNRLVRVEYPEGNMERFSYDERGNLIEYRDGENHSTFYEYNAYNKVILVTDAGGNRFYSYYDRWGNKTKDTDAEHNTNTFVYDELNRLLGETNSLGFHYSYTYDAMGNIIESRDPNGTRVVYTYTPDYFTDTITYTNGDREHIISYEYDEAGFRKRASNNGVITEYNIIDSMYEPDPYDKIYSHTTTCDEKTFGLSYSYDVMDRVTGITYPAAHTVNYLYNTLGQLTGVPGYIEEEPGYDNRGLLKRITAINGTTSEYACDANGRLINLSYTDTNLEEIQAYAITYDNAHNIIRNNFSMYNYDELNRLVYAELNGRFKVDAPDREQIAGLTEKDYIGEAVLDFTIGEDDIIMLDHDAGSIGIDLGKRCYVSRVELYPVNQDHRLHAKSVQVFVSDVNADGSFRKIDGTVLVQREDGVIELRLKQAENAQYVKIHCYFDDRDIQNKVLDKATFYNSAINIARVYYMLEWQRQGYTYDSAGNRVTSTINLEEPVTTGYSYYPNTEGGNSNRLRSDTAYEYMYDNNGNLIQKTEHATGAAWEYEFNLLNRLIAVRKKDSTAGDSHLIAGYQYNEAGYRIKKQSAENGITWYMFNASGKVLYEEKDTGDYKEYVYVSGKHFAKVAGNRNSDGNERKKYFYHTDHLGSTVAITDEAGEVVWKNGYTPFGSETGEIGIEEHDIKFTGKDYDEETGLYYFNARWYDADTGRFISEDTFKDGFNWYTYCGNNPIVYIDPSGNFFTSLFTGGATLWLDILLWSTCTEIGYELTQYISPIAIKFDFHLGTEQGGVGINVSIGIPKIIPVSYRVNYGATYYWKHYDNSYKGWETREGKDFTLFWVYSNAYTTFKSGETSQTTFQLTFGIPGLNLKIANDFNMAKEFWGVDLPFMPDVGGDRYRTAAGKLTIGPIALGFNLFTGDPGNSVNRRWEIIDGHPTYKESLAGDDPNKYRAGVIYFQIGPFRFGQNSEEIRHALQNELVHRQMKGPPGTSHLPYFKVLDIKPKGFFYFGNGTGGTLW